MNLAKKTTLQSRERHSNICLFIKKVMRIDRIAARNENNSSLVLKQLTFKFGSDLVNSYTWQDNTVGLSVAWSTDPSNIPALTHCKQLVMFCAILRALFRKMCLFHLPQFCEHDQLCYATNENRTPMCCHSTLLFLYSNH